MRRLLNNGSLTWTPTDDRQLRRLFSDLPAKDISRELRRTTTAVYRRARILRLKKSEQYTVARKAEDRARIREIGKRYRFPKGSVPKNKGTRRPGWSVGRMRETQFKKGGRSANYRLIGSLMTDVDGYVHIKVRDGIGGTGNPQVWPFLHRLNWEKANGPIPKGYVLRFKNGDKQDCDVSNLELVTQRENCLRNSIHNLPPELKEVIRLKGAIRRTITWRSHGQEQAVGPAQPSL